MLVQVMSVVMSFAWPVFRLDHIEGGTNVPYREHGHLAPFYEAHCVLVGARIIMLNILSCRRV